MSVCAAVARAPRERGWSKATAQKLAHFDQIVRQEIAMTQAAILCPHPTWPGWNPWPQSLLLDLNAGPGYIGAEHWPQTKDDLTDNPPGPGWSLRGSPLLTYRAALDHEAPHRLVLFEKARDHCERLREALIDELMDYEAGQTLHEWGRCTGCVVCDRFVAEDHLNETVTLIEGDHNVTVPHFLEEYRQVFADGKRPFFGLIYADPYGKNDLPLGPLVTLSKLPMLKRVEILINVGATTYKRVRGAGLPSSAYLFEQLAQIQRPYWWVREPIGKQQWTMLLGTSTPKLRMKKSIGFHRTDSLAGQALIARLNIATRETSP